MHALDESLTADTIKEYLEYGWMIFSVYFGEIC